MIFNCSRVSRGLLLIFLAAVSAFGQANRGSITGTVQDQSGAVVPNVPVEARNVETGAVFAAGASTTGNFVIPVPAGSYELSVTAAGFKKFVQTGVPVVEGSATALPFADESFDVTCSFKVLAHVPQIGAALAEMARVTRPGGHVIAEFYNPFSLRGLVKRYGPAGRIASGTHEKHVYTRFDSPRQVRALVPANCRLVAERGVRIATPTAHMMKTELGRRFFAGAERWLCDSRLRVFAGFYVVALEKLH